jgi:hypothetical protein
MDFVNGPWMSRPMSFIHISMVKHWCRSNVIISMGSSMAASQMAPYCLFSARILTMAYRPLVISSALCRECGAIEMQTMSRCECWVMFGMDLIKGMGRLNGSHLEL